MCNAQQVAPRFMMLHAEAAHPPVIVRSEGASVLIRELEKTHLKNKVCACRQGVLHSCMIAHLQMNMASSTFTWRFGWPSLISRLGADASFAHTAGASAS
jgi:hypothetical protein